MLCRLVNYWLLFMYSPWSLYYYLFFSKSLQDGRRAPHSFHCPEAQRGSNTLPGVTEGSGWDGSEASPVPRPCLETSFWDKEPKTRCGSFNSPSPMSVLPTLGFGFQMTQNPEPTPGLTWPPFWESGLSKVLRRGFMRLPSPVSRRKG